jgi:hypothetical protein
MTLSTYTGAVAPFVPDGPLRPAVNDLEEFLPVPPRSTPTEEASTQQGRAGTQSTADAVDCPSGCHYCEGPETD